MFYKETFTENKLRFGDIIEGYVESIPRLEKPFFGSHQHNYSYKIKSFFPKFSSIITPCCNIEEKIIALTPLLKIPPELFRNEHFRNDFTILNEEVEQDKLFPKWVWRTCRRDIN